MPLNPPAFSPPKWPRLGRAAGVTTSSLGLAPAPVEIPVCWLTQPVKLRLERPFTTSAVGRSGESPVFDFNDTARAAYGDYRFTATLNTSCTADAANLAHWVVTYRATPLTRAPELVVDLMHRPDVDRMLLLGLQRNQRIKIIGVPPEFPQGAQHLIISGIHHDIGVHARRIRLVTRPVIGTAPGTAGPWFRVGTSAVGGPDTVLF